MPPIHIPPFHHHVCHTPPTIDSAPAKDDDDDGGDPIQHPNEMLSSSPFATTMARSSGSDTNMIQTYESRKLPPDASTEGMTTKGASNVHTTSTWEIASSSTFPRNMRQLDCLPAELQIQPNVGTFIGGPMATNTNIFLSTPQPSDISSCTLTNDPTNIHFQSQNHDKNHSRSLSLAPTTTTSLPDLEAQHLMQDELDSRWNEYKKQVMNMHIRLLPPTHHPNNNIYDFCNNNEVVHLQKQQQQQQEDGSIFPSMHDIDTLFFTG
jgi:hypothetical protein